MAMSKERRKHQRFSATAFLNRPVSLTPLLPFFGSPLEGKLIDMSAGGLAVAIRQVIPEKTELALTIQFPDGTTLESIVEVVHAIPRGHYYLHGFKFLTLAQEKAEWIDKMSTDYLSCEARIQSKAKDVCQRECAFFKMCTKREKLEPATAGKGVLTIQLEKRPKP